MSEGDTIKVEIELPKDQIHIISDEKTKSLPAASRAIVSSDDQKIEKFKKKIAEASKEATQPKTADKPATSTLSESVSEISQKDTSPPNPSQKRIITIGLVVALIGLLLWPLSNFWLAIAVAVVGSAVVATATFVKV